MMLDFYSPDGSVKLTVEDDGKVAYGYLKMDNRIVGDVWLYNRIQAPPKSEWANKANIPFANCEEFVLEGGTILRPVAPNEISAEWENGLDAYVYVREDLFAVVGVGDKPGYARYAASDSPLARVMQIAPET
ncbi:hypothetical protein [Fuerstiella marisgermanici]|uniref:Uncharacterized protein n=1 Tax=Fuerstiella marisgermanici TaxID=1891926 RepID=A0A1P8WMX2_9PLAN|nr:hypothetical protein [Fuerstiella marisgermanici]APZ95413.1 hypothetical protein Fuma_05071 [Fuerstiella marisgermanici]